MEAAVSEADAAYVAASSTSPRASSSDGSSMVRTRFFEIISTACDAHT